MSHKTGVLMVNLGSPDAPTPAAVRTYLAEFLHDYRVVDLSRWLWCPILHGVILRVRPRRSAKAYQSIWSQPDGIEGGEAPLVRLTRAQVEAVQENLGDSAIVKTAMRYGNPSIASQIDALIEQGCDRIGILPMYPQYAGATTASVHDGVLKAFKTRMDMPELRFIRDYHSDPDYIKALAASVTSHLKTLDFKPDVILASYHGLPQRFVDRGDPYRDECKTTTDLLRKQLKYTDAQLQLTFQSRFGAEAWLQPYTDKTLEALAAQGVKNVCVMTPGFSADCLETLEEINIEARHSFLSNGGENFSYIPCLNSDDLHIKMLTKLVKTRLLDGWS